MRALAVPGIAVAIATVAGSSYAQDAPSPPTANVTVWTARPLPPAPAVPPPPVRLASRFGDRGQLAISNDFDLSVVNQSISDDGGSTTTLSVAPAADYFVARNLSVGGMVSLAYATSTSGGQVTTSQTTFGIGPRVGYDIPFGDRFSLWPRIAFLFSDASAPPISGAFGSSAPAYSVTTFDIQLFAPLLWHPSAHFFVGLGPFFQTDLASTYSSGGTSSSWMKTTAFGVKLDLGGWVSASSRPPSPPPAATADDAPPPPPAAPRRFADRGQLAISNDVDLSFLAQSVSDQGGSQWTLSIAPGADYFVLRGLSVGGQVSFTRTWTKTYYTNLYPPTTTFAMTATDDSYGIGPRVGYAIRIEDAVSLWPRLALLYGQTVASTTPAGARGTTQGSTFDVQLFAPIVWTPAGHFFLGLGPFVQTDVTASSSVNGQSVPADKTTTLGVKLDLGGWLE